MIDLSIYLSINIILTYVYVGYFGHFFLLLRAWILELLVVNDLELFLADYFLDDEEEDDCWELDWLDCLEMDLSLEL